MGPSGSALAPGQGSGGHRCPLPKKGKKIKSRNFSKFLTVLGLMWGGRLGGFMGNLELSSSDHHQSCIRVLRQLLGAAGHQGPRTGQGRLPSVLHSPRSVCAQLPQPHVGRIRPGIPGIVWSGDFARSIGGWLLLVLPLLCRGMAPTSLPACLPGYHLPSPGHPTEAARARCTHGARVLTPRPGVPPRHGLTMP